MSTNRILTIKSKARNGYPHINITGGSLNTKFSILQSATKYRATSATGNFEFVQFLDGLLGGIRDESTGYYWWDIPQDRVITVLNAVIDRFGVSSELINSSLGHTKHRGGKCKTMKLRSGETPTTQIGYVNRNGQMCRGHRGKAGNDHLQFAYKMYCKHCRAEYGANGTDIHLRKCPNCQGGALGIEY